jgi:glycosyltransferase involved in cell wall biosynthesis
MARQQPIRVCLATALFPPTIGGEERHASMLAEALRRRGHAVTVVTQQVADVPRGEIAEGVRVERVIRPVRVGPFFGPSYVAGLARFLLTHRRAFDIIQTTYVYWDAVAVALLKPFLTSRLLVRLVVAGPGGDLDRFLGMRLWPLTATWDRSSLDRLVQLVVRRADGFLCLNAKAQREIERLGVPQSHCHVVPNGIEVSRFVTIPRVASAGEEKVLCVARLVPQKGIDVLLRAFVRVRAEAGNARLAVLGEGPERQRLARMAAELGLGDAVEFRGAVKDIAVHLATAGVFALPSRFEGLPLALLEAMAAGLPVVATDVDGNADVVRDGVDGLLVPSDDPGALAKALLHLIRDPGLAARLGNEARRRAASSFSVDTMLDRTVEVYRQVLRQGTSGGNRKD